MPERPKGSVSSTDEQWSVVDHQVRHLADHLCRYSLVLLRSSRGRMSRGLKCFDCGQLELITDRQWESHGRRLERSKP